MPLIGVDIGTTGCKCTIFDFEGKILSYAYREYPVESPGEGLYELNPDTVWDSVKHVIGKSSANCIFEGVTALSVSSIGEAAVPVDRTGKVLHNSILFTDIRGQEQAEYLKESCGPERIMELTGIPVHSMYTVNKIMWFKKNVPHIFRETWKFLLYEDFIIFRLTGIPVIDYSLASRTMAFNVTKKCWEPEILNAAGLNESIFSVPVPSGTVVGGIIRETSEELGLPDRTIVVTGGHDQACAALGAGIISGRQAVEGVGTADCIATAFDRPVLSRDMLKNNFNCGPHLIEDMYISLSFASSGGSILKWYRDCFATAEAVEAANTNTSVYKLLDKRASKNPTSLLVLPHFSGSGTPFMDPRSKGAIMGLTLETTASQYYRALMEGITYEMRYNLECLETAGISVESLRAVGGGSKSDLWMQIKADITGKKVETLYVDEAGTLAVAILAGVAAGVYESCKEAVNKLVRVKKVFYPDPAVSQIYEENFSGIRTCTDT